MRLALRICNIPGIFARGGTFKFFSTAPRIKPETAQRAASNNSEAERLAEQAKMSQNLWDFLVPERNMGVTHPFFLVLLVLTLSLHFYNNHRDHEDDERLRQQRIRKKSLES
jgi:hypothetical protein